MEHDPVDRLNPELDGPANFRLARARQTSGSPPAARAAPSRRPHALLLVTLIAIGLALALAAYAVETDRNAVAMGSLAAAAVVAVAMAFTAHESIRNGKRACVLLERALAGSERARDELHAANEALQGRNVALEAFQHAVVQGFDFIDARTQGRLKELVEEAGDELAALVDDVLDDPIEGA